MTLIQTDKIRHFPVILIGEEFWAPMREWLRANMLDAFQNIDPQDLNMFTITDDLDQAVSIIVRSEQEAQIAVPAAYAPDGKDRITAEGTRFGVPPARSIVRNESSR
jgi:predicted Rossmann-fold nucleotide-binding protein